ncbi:drug resistance transporter, Bcr/CflA subfamily [Hymenobacter roseosalivarius DSM 11622]|uniref:Drug resistance transporter, Bcr/CflA subfamily n=1 Tax=Hymenobacter roseosalivarius DSM 11622 TaxID=645990 RepID=A0A1W1VYB4_9BACT|nr:multidrug effflux MFS transporter [Hymenobacter roseosalivarius]SMB98379.1 drug resistance transporter, Bcr/CflA subfamily [Hymenobacter roseosalivarius DSM 11622]
MSKQQYFFLILILGSLSALGPFSIDMYLPGFPAIAQDLNTTAARVTLSLSSFFVGISAGQLLYGPLLDRFGRKKPLYVGLAVYVLASIGCATVHTINGLIVLRLVQAIGSCAAGVASVAMIRDLFPVKDSAKVFALIMLVIGLSPMIAPTAGSYVTAAFGWHGVFIVLAAMGLLLLVATFLWLPETYKPDTTMSLKPRPILTNFWAVLREPQFYTYTFTGAMSFCGLFAYVAGSPLVFMGIFGVDGKVYGWIFAFLSVGLIGASQVNSYLLRYYQNEQLVHTALICQVLTGLVFLVLISGGWIGLNGTIALLFIFLCCLGFSSPNTAALSLAPFSRNAGSASALMGATRMAMGALASMAVSVFSNGTTVPMVSIMAVTSVVALFLLLTGRRHITEQVEVSAEQMAEPVH